MGAPFQKTLGLNGSSPAMVVIINPLMTKKTSTPSLPVFNRYMFNSGSGHCNVCVTRTLSAAMALKY